LGENDITVGDTLYISISFFGKGELRDGMIVDPISLC